MKKYRWNKASLFDWPTSWLCYTLIDFLNWAHYWIRSFAPRTEIKVISWRPKHRPSSNDSQRQKREHFGALKTKKFFAFGLRLKYVFVKNLRYAKINRRQLIGRVREKRIRCKCAIILIRRLPKLFF
jgi:hypothetical protein